MKYLQQHAKQALEIMQRCMPLVPQRREYDDLVDILAAPARWKEAHDQFSAIRTNITLPFERQKKKGAEASFVFIAENAAKTAYNCSGEPAPFDDDSFEWLLRCEQEFLDQQRKEANQTSQPTRFARA